MPEKRALVCGVADYGHLKSQTNLPGALTSARAWAARLEQQYGYPKGNIDLWENAKATKKAVLNRLRELFAGAAEGDDIMFIVACHGTSIKRDDAVGEKQGMVLYPKDGDKLLDATVFGSDIADAASATEHGDRVHFNCVFDFCFGGGVHPPPPPTSDAHVLRFLSRLVPQRIIPPEGSAGAAQTFVDDIDGPLSQPTRPSTMIIAAAGEKALAYEGVPDATGERWTLFSWAALKALRSKPDHTYRTLVEQGVPPYLSIQEPVWRGSRPNYLFARRVEAQLGFAGRQKKSLPISAIPGSTTLDVLIVGISCIAKVGEEDVPRRVLFPTDNLWYPSYEPHVAFLEIEEEDLLSEPGTIIGLSERYSRYGRNYRRFELNGHRISIDNIDSEQGFTEKDLYKNHVPQMKLVQPALSQYPKQQCYDDKPPTSLIAGYFDINYGILSVRRVAPYKLEFLPKASTLMLPGYFAVSAQLSVKVNGPAPVVILVENLANGIVSPVRLKPTAREITIGNLTTSVLLGNSGGDDLPHDFELFYNLAGEPVPPLVVPSQAQGLETACIPVGWP
ncbi:MAG TPA: caspase family protein [Thermoanaerobaculia bacterium]|nr:caspase family protein [Thermoanaerobaculia bacterium]